jgi:hypothetical protein
MLYGIDEDDKLRLAIMLEDKAEQKIKELEGN